MKDGVAEMPPARQPIRTRQNPGNPSCQGMPLLPRACAFAALLLLGPTVSAQTIFVAVTPQGARRLVVDIVNGSPVVEVAGKREGTNAVSFDLLPAPVFRTGMLQLDDFALRSSAVQLMDQASQLVNHRVELKSNVTSDVPLTQCYVVIEFHTSEGRGVIYADIPDLPAGRKIPIELAFGIDGPLGDGRYQLHFYSGSDEILHSRFPAPYIAAQKKKLSDLQGGQTRIGAIVRRTVPPITPASYRQQVPSAPVQVRCTVAATGRVTATEILRSVSPEVDAAVVAALRQWEFDPAIADRKFVESPFVVSLRVEPLGK